MSWFYEALLRAEKERSKIGKGTHAASPTRMEDRFWPQLSRPLLLGSQKRSRSTDRLRLF